MAKSTFNQIIQKYREQATSKRRMGEDFERLIRDYLMTTKLYASKFAKVWMWEDFPYRKAFGGQDTGIDLVAYTYEGTYWAIQCKFFSEDSSIQKADVDSFLATSNRTFVNEDLEDIGFSNRLWVSTTNKWSKNAEDAIQNQNPPVSRISLSYLEEDEVDWAKLDQGIFGQKSRPVVHKLFDHQQEALDATHEHFKHLNRGKLIMACGTGKTFTSLKIAENETGDKGLVLFLVPSIALLGQTLREWTQHSTKDIHPICICSDSRISRQEKHGDDDAISIVDLALPASTDINNILGQLNSSLDRKGMTVVFSTYQSIEVIANAQKAYQAQEGKEHSGVFDLVICDEAHRTTGVKLKDEDASAFTKVHYDENVEAHKRLYMTATPRLYSESAKDKASESDAVLCSMDDETVYGPEIYRIGFGEAVDRNLLSDYKVLVLTIGEDKISPTLQRILSQDDVTIEADDLPKMIGCINGLSKRLLGDADIIKASDPEPMRRAVAFCQTIKKSKATTELFEECAELYRDDLPSNEQKEVVRVSAQHIDGTMSAPEREEKLSWLKSVSDDDMECRMLTNVRCLSEGVDVPSLDSVLFLSSRNSQVDVVQSVGRVMRKSPGKKYGYIIIPVVIPVGVDAAVSLEKSDRFKVVWDVLNALRSHDDRFEATINQIELNKNKPKQILIGDGGAGNEFSDGDGIAREDRDKYNATSEQLAKQLNLQFEEMQSTFFARMVEKVGNKRYWEQWARDVAQIAQEHIAHIMHLIKTDERARKAFDEFLSGLHKNINPSVSEQEAVDMLAQHIITKPVFEALFDDFSFVENNPISKSMQRVMDSIEDKVADKDNVKLQRFYDSVRRRAKGIDNAEGKQKIVIELYEKFFKTAFPKTVEQLGIVYTPVEVVDFIIHSVEDVLQKEFNRSISDENIHILDPFTGTGTFITRLLSSGLIKPEDLDRKYMKELHANEIVLLAYYIASVNIENTYHDLSKGKDYH
jgi:predicted helicase